MNSKNGKLFCLPCIGRMWIFDPIRRRRSDTVSNTVKPSRYQETIVRQTNRDLGSTRFWFLGPTGCGSKIPGAQRNLLILLVIRKINHNPGFLRGFLCDSVYRHNWLLFSRQLRSRFGFLSSCAPFARSTNGCGGLGRGDPGRYVDEGGSRLVEWPFLVGGAVLFGEFP